jgi:sugar-specific transcriptional regulator TrmB
MSELNLIDLVDFGLTFLQAKVFVALLQMGTSRASQVSANVGIMRPETYRVLNELSVMGLVQKNLEYPTTFSAVEPKTALTVMFQAKKEKLMALDKKRIALIKSLSTMRPTPVELTQPLRIVSGGGNLIRKVNQMIREAKTDYAGIISKTGLARLKDDGGALALVLAKKRGLRVRVIIELDASNIKVANYLARHLEVRQSHGLLYYVDIVDKKELSFGPAFPSEGPDAHALASRQLDVWTSNPPFVRGMYAMFERLWEFSPKYYLT